jgi:ribosomal protein S18 acetylase RimI-like enzyme
MLPREGSFRLRPAEPRDVEAAVPLICSSGPEAFDFVFMPAQRGGPLQFLRRAFVDGAGEFGWRNHLVIEHLAEGRVVATGAGYSGRTALPYLLAGARQIIASQGLAAPGVILRGLRTEGVIPPPTGRQLYYIAHLGVAPEWRGQGLGVWMTQHLLDQGRQQGFATAALDVSARNPRAQALYERLGFRVTREQRSSLSNAYASVPDHRRMELPLAGG